MCSLEMENFKFEMGEQTSLIYQLQRTVDKQEADLLMNGLRQSLKREPTDDDIKMIELLFVRGEFNYYTVNYSGKFFGKMHKIPKYEFSDNPVTNSIFFKMEFEFVILNQ